jgi:hypothetical protein
VALLGNIEGGHAKVDHPGMWLTQPEDDLAKIPIISHENPLLLVGDSKYLCVREIRWEFGANAARVVTPRAEVNRYSRVATRVDKES